MTAAMNVLLAWTGAAVWTWIAMIAVRTVARPAARLAAVLRSRRYARQRLSQPHAPVTCTACQADREDVACTCKAPCPSAACEAPGTRAPLETTVMPGIQRPVFTAPVNGHARRESE